MLWIVLALALGAALLAGYLQTAQAQQVERWVFEVVQTPDPLVAGSDAGAALSVRASFVPTTTRESITRVRLSQPVEFTVNVPAYTAPGASSQSIGFRSSDPNNDDISRSRTFGLQGGDLACDDFTARPVVCYVPLGSARNQAFYAGPGSTGSFDISASASGGFEFQVTEDGQTNIYSIGTWNFGGTLTVATTAPSPTPEPTPTPDPGTVDVGAPPTAGLIADLSAERGSGEVELRWSDPGDSSITGYQYRYKVREDEYGEWTDIADSGADTTEHTVTGLVNGRRHTFQIRPVGGDPSNEVTATPARSRPQLDDFDDPDQPPEPPLPPPPDRTSTFLESGGTLRSQPLSPSRPVRVTVQSPSGGFVAITIESNEQRIAPPGYTLEAATAEIIAPMASANAPLVLTFEVRTMVAPDDLAVLRDGVVVAECTGTPGVAAPDPCVSSRTAGNGTAVLTVLTSQASEWQFGVSLESESTPTPTSPPPPTLTPTPTATATPTPGPSATPTATPRPTATPTPPPTSTPIPTATPRLTSTPTPTPPAPQPTSTPVPPMDEGGLSAGLIALIVVAAVVIVGALVFALRRR